MKWLPRYLGREGADSQRVREGGARANFDGTAVIKNTIITGNRSNNVTEEPGGGGIYLGVRERSRSCTAASGTTRPTAREAASTEKEELSLSATSLSRGIARMIVTAASCRVVLPPLQPPRKQPAPWGTGGGLSVKSRSRGARLSHPDVPTRRRSARTARVTADQPGHEGTSATLPALHPAGGPAVPALTVRRTGCGVHSQICGLFGVATAPGRQPRPEPRPRPTAPSPHPLLTEVFGKSAARHPLLGLRGISGRVRAALYLEEPGAHVPSRGSALQGEGEGLYARLGTEANRAGVSPTGFRGRSGTRSPSCSLRAIGPGRHSSLSRAECSASRGSLRSSPSRLGPASSP